MPKLPLVSSLPFHQQEVKTLARLRELVGDFVNDIITSHKAMDPDWLWDLVSGLDGAPPTGPNNSIYNDLERFWEPLVSAGYKSVHFDCKAISLEIYAQLEAEWRENNPEEDEDDFGPDNLDPSGGYGLKSHE